jgi:hypothetical protein
MIAQRLPVKRAASGHSIACMTRDLTKALAAIEPFDETARGGECDGRSWIRTTDLRLIRAAL